MLLSTARIGLGCAGLGLPRDRQTDAEAEAVISLALEKGIKFFDVAPLYGGGLAEERLGRALRGARRDDMFVSTKIGVDRPYGQGPIPDGGTVRREAAIWDYRDATTRRSLFRSMDRLGTDRFDVVHIHDVENHIPARLSAFETLSGFKAKGVVGKIGVGVNVVEAAAAVLARTDLAVILLARLTLLDRSGRRCIDEAARSGKTVFVGGVFNSGILARWPMPDATFFNDVANESTRRRTAEVAAICAKHNVPLARATLQFPYRVPAVERILLGPSTRAELLQNLEHLSQETPDALWRDIDAFYEASPSSRGERPAAS